MILIKKIKKYFLYCLKIFALQQILTVSLVAREIVYYKKQPRSLINWDNIDTEKWHDYETWLVENNEKKKLPDWEVNLRDSRLKEEVGRVVACSGECKIYRDDTHHRVRFRSKIIEKDELRTVGESYLWVFLYDGTMVRLSPKSSMNFKEINVGLKRNFFHARINKGNILWLDRNNGKFIEQDLRETDTVFFPMEFKESRNISKEKKVKEDDLYSLLENDDENKRVYRKLNKLIEENNEKMNTQKITSSFIVLPNGTIHGNDISMEFIVLSGGESMFKYRTKEMMGYKENDVEQDPKVKVYMRGFENKKVNTIKKNLWYKIGEKGRSFSQKDATRNLNIGEFITRRIPTMLVARELLLKKYSSFMFTQIEAKDLGLEFGYRMWEKYKIDGKNDLELRTSFLEEFTRRQETQNLVISEIFYRRRIRRKEKITKEVYDQSYFKKAITNYLGHRETYLRSYTLEDYKLMNSMKKKFWKKIHEQ